jgi:integrase
VRYHAEQLLWARGGVEDDPKSLFDGTIDSLIEIYQKHKKSPFKKLRHQSQLSYTAYMRALNTTIGKVCVAHVTFEDLTDWQDQFADDGNGGELKARASNLIRMLKRIITFGALVLPKSVGCHDVRDIFAAMAEAQMMGGGSRQRKEYMTVAQCRLLRHSAHAMGHHSIALEQAFAFELGARQKDVIGEWIPVGFPGVTDVVRGPRKWLMGFRWEEIDANLILTHRLSKSVRGNKNVIDTEAGKVKAWDLRACPMVMDELRTLVSKEHIERSDLPACGPLIVCEGTGLPWAQKTFRDNWKRVAVNAGIPANIQNRDSRPGAATEAKLAGAPRDDIQRQLGHADGKTTEIYLREEVEEQRKLAKLRVEKRKP